MGNARNEIGLKVLLTSKLSSSHRVQTHTLRLMNISEVCCWCKDKYFCSTIILPHQTDGQTEIVYLRTSKRSDRSRS